jgi:hypothetical protein
MKPGELAPPPLFTHMRTRKSADGIVANLVRSGRKQPQRFRAGSSASTSFHYGSFDKRRGQP